MEWSAFGEKFTQRSGIAMLMEDLEEGARSGALMMGGGNPAQIPEVKAEVTRLATSLLEAKPGGYSPIVEALSNYDGPRGKAALCDALVNFLNGEFGWKLTSDNLALTNGSQTSFFYIFNLLCGPSASGDTKKKVLLPVCPEYLGYADVGISSDLFVAAKPRIEISEEDRSFKYRLDLDGVRQILKKNDGSRGIGIICVSRPTNPTGNVLTDAEIDQLHSLAREYSIPFIIDGAYGLPFPKIFFTEEARIPHFSNDAGLILCLSLSKLGLPGARTGVVIAAPKLTKAITNLNGVLSLAPGSVGPAMLLPLLEDPGRMNKLCDNAVRPWYKRRAIFAKNELLKALDGERRVLVHKPEGCIFLWVWCRDLPIHSDDLYKRLKARGVLAIPGHFFFPGLADADKWAHTTECLRVSYAAIADDEKLVEGLKKVAQGIMDAYSEPKSLGQHEKDAKQAADIDAAEPETKCARVG
mmetsp:Transcript_8133/g.13004  ORF Transcript_8133/g.13004 Transcript_8133/m.13004 type:complete len:469 (+) Transcript_8133:60-1466(+)